MILTRNAVPFSSAGPPVSADFAVASERKAETTRDGDGDVAVASVWLALYLLMLVGTVVAPVVGRAVDFAAPILHQAVPYQT
jgi:hypothetical protein